MSNIELINAFDWSVLVVIAAIRSHAAFTAASEWCPHFDTNLDTKSSFGHRRVDRCTIVEAPGVADSFKVLLP